MQCGLLLGPTGIGETWVSSNYLFPYRYALAPETFSNLSLIYYVFLVGLEIDLSLIKRSGTKAFSIAMAGILLPFLVAIFFYSKVIDAKKKISKNSFKGAFWAVALGATNFPDLVVILSELK